MIESCSSPSGVHRPPNVEGEIVWRSLAHLLYNQRNTNKKNSHTHSTHTMSRCHPTPSGFALSLSMGRAAVRPNHGAAAPHRHAEAASYRGRARCRWFACLGGVGHFNQKIKGYGYIIVEDQWPWPPRCLVRGRGYSVKSKYKLQSNVDCESVVVLISVVLFRLHMKIHARVSSACQARVRRGTSPYRLHTRDRILSLASYSFLYILFTFLAPMAGEDTPSIRAYFISPLKISSGTGGHWLVLSVLWSYIKKVLPTGLRRVTPLVTLVRESARLSWVGI